MKSRIVKNDQPCPKCPSRDAYHIYDDGHGHCYSCGHTTNPKGEFKTDDQFEKTHKFRPLPEVYHDLKDRKITAAVAKKYQVTSVQDEESKWKYVYPFFDNDNHHVANKLRHRIKKDFVVEGDWKRATLFGQQAFPPGSAKTITLTEGQDDAMAAYQMFGSRYPVVSVHSTSEAVKNVADNFEYLNSFETIVVNFDHDEGKVKPDGTVHYPGQEAAVAVAGMFAPGKVRVLTLPDAKDANDYLINGWEDRYVKAWWAAPPFVPGGLKLGRNMWDEVSERKKIESIPYPYELMNKSLYGLRLSEVVIVTADTGVGKTQLLKELEHHILSTTDKGVGFLHLEESNADTALGLMSITADKPLHLPDVRDTVDDDELRAYFDHTINTDRVVIWDHFGSNSVHEVLAKIRHMHNLGCKYIFLDHLSIVVSDQSGDERKQLDEISTKLKTLCMELDIAVIAVIHQNRQGQIRSSAGPEQIANIVLKLHRDKTDPDPWRRNITKLVCEKNRFSGDTGPVAYLYYDRDTGRLIQLDEDAAKKYEAGGTVDTSGDEGWPDPELPETKG